ncbi:MAG TPA: sensor histidine kinase [Gemmatimonas aurantiaca]|uniref:histidine kinase n=2 Tax=Gemmatimonas aurantiaca TaxID=173480 RepID=C1A977_GEMAT|nr:HAMP domain-containing sensor histidine kinase [Gemmatimonas aurantiaca]BAH39054.1 two-component histidine kinase [Gemmatimonas aurantiaca T-27]HCT57352.1 sensor histidine kinase [Gemmatimonas aurantiaca]
MSSIRARLTRAWTGAFLLTLFLFSLTLLAVRRETLYRELEARVQLEADQAVRAINVARNTGTEPVMAQKNRLEGPSIGMRMSAFLSLLEGYVLVQDSTGYDIYASPAVQALSAADRDYFSTAARKSEPDRKLREVKLYNDQLLLATRVVPLSDNARYRVYAGLSTANISFTPAELMGPMFVITPLLLVLSVTFAYLIAGRAFRPIDELIDQVEAITDGRSLHSRLGVTAAGDELTRLSETLNAFIGRLEKSFGALRRFTADASHELKTPLAVIRADVERAISPTTNETEQAIALEEALQQVTRMADLVDSLLTLARADEGRFDLFREPVELMPVAREVLETARLLGEDQDLEIEAPVLENAEVLGDLTRLRQLFLNLVTNAIKYTPRGGRVEISLAREEDVVRFIVKDSGIGIAAADLPHVFERFWRADLARSRASERGGWGLGLAISQWIAQAHGGTLEVQSRLTRGSTFTVTLPLAGSPGSGMTGEFQSIVNIESLVAEDAT